MQAIRIIGLVAVVAAVVSVGNVAAASGDVTRAPETVETVLAAVTEPADGFNATGSLSDGASGRGRVYLAPPRAGLTDLGPWEGVAVSSAPTVITREWLILPALDCDAVPSEWVDSLIGAGERGPRTNTETGWTNVKPDSYSGSGEAIYHPGRMVAVTFAC